MCDPFGNHCMSGGSDSMWTPFYGSPEVSPKRSGIIMSIPECDICLESYETKGERRPMTLPCGHTCCGVCIKNLHITKCPHCRMVIDVIPGYNTSMVDMITTMKKGMDTIDELSMHEDSFKDAIHNLKLTIDNIGLELATTKTQLTERDVIISEERKRMEVLKADKLDNEEAFKDAIHNLKSTINELDLELVTTKSQLTERDAEERKRMDGLKADDKRIKALIKETRHMYHSTFTWDKGVSDYFGTAIASYAEIVYACARMVRKWERDKNMYFVDKKFKDAFGCDREKYTMKELLKMVTSQAKCKYNASIFDGKD